MPDSNPLQTPVPVGEQLRSARERQGLDLPTLARALRIPVRTLDALERGDFSSLPADVYVRGFLKQYATTLGLDPVPLLRASALERARTPNPTITFPWIEQGRQRSKAWEFLTPRAIALIAGGFGLSVALLYVILQVRTYARAPRLEVFDPPHDTEVQGPVLAVRGHTDPTAELSINGERALIHEDGTFEESIGLGEGVNTLRFLAKSIGGRETVVVREVLVRPGATTSAGLGASPLPSVEPRPTSPNDPMALTLRADAEAVWISVTVDGKTAFSGLLLPGSEQSVRGGVIAVTSGKAARTHVRIDGTDRGVLADTPGVVRSVIFTRNPTSGTIEQRHEPAKVPPQ